MMVKDIILNISAVFPFRLKVTAGIIDHLTAVKYKLQILKLQSVQIHFFTWRTPPVPARTGEVNTSPTGIFTSATQFSKFVCF